MEVERVRPDSERWTELHGGRITPSRVNTIMGNSQARSLLVEAMAADLAGEDRDPLTDDPYIAMSHIDKRGMLMRHWPYEDRDDVNVNIDIFCTSDEHRWLAAAPQLLVGPLESPEFGASVRPYRRLSDYRQQSLLGAHKCRTQYTKVQMLMLITDVTRWDVLHVWEDLKRGLSQSRIVTVARDEVRIAKIQIRCLEFMLEASQVCIRRAAA